jgi:hypothetical protein
MALFDALKEVAETTVGPGGSDVVGGIESLVRGGPVFQAPESMLGRVFQAAARLTKAFPKAIDGDSKAQLRALQAASEIVSAATGAPLGGPEQIVSVAQGIARQATE